MAQMKKVRVCMAPSVAIRSRNASTMGNIVEQMVLRDYLRDTSRVPPHPFERPAVTIENWWDTGNQQHYKEILLLRHKQIDEGGLRRMRRLRVPDLSTWLSEYRHNSVGIQGYTGRRSEYYEVKPDSVWGEVAGIEKLFIIGENNSDLALTEYRLGTWYPEPSGPSRVGKAEIQFTSYGYVLAGFQYSLRRLERAAKRARVALKIGTPFIEIERRREGLLLYLLCVELEVDFDGEEAIAKKVMSRLYKALTTNMQEQQRLFELQFVDTLVPTSRDHKPRPPRPIDPITATVLRSIEIEEQYLAREINMIDELRPSVNTLAQTLFSRLRGLPGERYIICSDETYYNDEIKAPNRQRMIDRMAPLQLRPPLPMGAALVGGGVMVKAAAPVLATLYVLGKIVDRPDTIFSIRSEWVKALKWLEANPAFTLLVGSVVVYGTAIVVASAGAAGAVAMYGGGAVAASSGLAVGPGGLAAETTGFGLVRGLATGGLRELALPPIERQLAAQIAAEARGVALPLVERQVAERLLIEEGQALAADEADQLIDRLLKQLAEQQAERILLRQAVKRSAPSAVSAALATGGLTIAAVSARMAIGLRKVTDPIDEAAASKQEPVAIEIGHLYLLRLFDAVRNEDLPQLRNQFDTTKYSPELAGVIAARGEATDPMPKRRYLGVFECL
jgi:hypothetical protein